MTRNYQSIKPKPTKYGPIKFRSRLEAKWAVFFDAAGIGWQYEPQRFRWGWSPKTLGYCPDFAITDGDGYFESSTWIEVKPGRPTPTELAKAALLVVETGWPVDFCTSLASPIIRLDVTDGRLAQSTWMHPDIDLLHAADNQKF